MRPYALKAGELRPGRGAAVLEYVTQKGEEPPLHTHDTEDEIFYVLQGDLTFHCGDENFEVGAGGFVYLPMGIEHSYTIRSAGAVRLLVVTFPIRPDSGTSWNGFVGDLESRGELRKQPSP